MNKHLNSDDWKMVGGIFWRIIFASVLSLILYFSLGVLSTGIFAEKVGYVVYNENGEQIEKVMVEDGYVPDQEITVQEGQSYTVLREIRSKTTVIICDCINLILMLVMLASFVYSQLWLYGTKDDNRVASKRKAEDKWRGVKIAALANVPDILLFLLVILAKCGLFKNWPLAVYRFANIPFIPYLNWIVDTSVGDMAAISVGSLLAMGVILLYVPAVGGIAYLLGYKQISLTERITYKKKK